MVKKNDDGIEHPFDKYARKQQETRRLCRTQWICLQAEILTLREQNLLWHFLWKNCSVVDPTGELRCKMLPMIPIAEIEKVLKDVGFIPETLEQAIEKKRRKELDQEEDRWEIDDEGEEETDE